jgi:hypothetical protein
MKAFLSIALLLAAGVLVSCGPPEPKKRKNFNEYLTLQPGATVKIVYDITISGYAPEAMRNAVTDVEEAGVVGELIRIDKETVSIQEKGKPEKEGRISFGPSAVKRIVILSSGTATP